MVSGCLVSQALKIIKCELLLAAGLISGCHNQAFPTPDRSLSSYSGEPIRQKLLKENKKQKNIEACSARPFYPIVCKKTCQENAKSGQENNGIWE